MNLSGIILITLLAIGIVGLLVGFIRRYKRCSSDQVLVIYGKVGSNKAGLKATAKCVHGGAAFIWPIIQDYKFLDLKPIPIKVDVKSALSKQNIRLDVPTQFTVAISTDQDILQNAAERLLGLTPTAIGILAQDIILGQMRLIIATMDIEEINADRDKFLTAIQNNVETELKKIGLKLINVNIVDIQDEAGYIIALGKEAAAKAVNDAKKSVAEKSRDGAIGEAEALQDEVTRVSDANAKGAIGKADAQRLTRVRLAEADATAVEGENLSIIKIAESDSLKRSRQAEAIRVAVASEKVNEAKALEESYTAQTAAELARANKEKATLEANTIVNADIEKRKMEINAEAVAEVVRREARGKADEIKSIAQAEADSIFMKMDATAKGTKEILNSQAVGFAQLVEAAGGNSDAAVQFLIAEKLEDLIKIQAEAIQNIKFDKITVWDSGNGNGSGEGGSTGNFIKSMFTALPPMKEMFDMTGNKIPAFLDGKTDQIQDDKPYTQFDSAIKTDQTKGKKDILKG